MSGAKVSQDAIHAWTTNAWEDGIHNADPSTLQEAMAANSVGFSFSGGGFLLPYYLGTIQALMQLGLVRPGVTHVGGSSAGSLIAAALAAGIPLEAVIDTVKLFMAECRKSGVFRKLGPGLKASLESLLPEDAHVRCSGTIHIAITKVKAYGAFRSKRVTSFSSREDLIQALLASCHLPILSTGSLTTKYRGRSVVDGGVTDLMPVPAAPKHVVKITCLPLDCIKRMPMRNRHITERHISISPCRFREWPWDHRQTVKYMLGPGPEEVVDWLITAGQQDVASWALSAGMVLSPPLAGLAVTTLDSYQAGDAGSTSTATGAEAVDDEQNMKTSKTNGEHRPQGQKATKDRVDGGGSLVLAPAPVVRAHPAAATS